jgi:hypothetical protein
VFPDREIVVSLIRQLTWTHFIALIPLDKPLQRDFYAETIETQSPYPRADSRVHRVQLPWRQ